MLHLAKEGKIAKAVQNTLNKLIQIHGTRSVLFYLTTKLVNWLIYFGG